MGINENGLSYSQVKNATRNSRQEWFLMPIEIKIILLFGLCWFTYEYIKQSIIKLIKKNEQLK